MNKIILPLQNIIEYSEQIRLSVNPGGQLYLNYYQQSMPNALFAAFLSTSSKTIVFLQPEEQLNRVFFVSSDLNDLTATLQGITDKFLVLDYIGKELDTELGLALQRADFYIIAKIGRITNFHFCQTTSNYEPVVATAAHVKPLLKRMHEDFNRTIDHLCDHSQLVSLIKLGQVLLNINRDNITGYLLYELQGKKSHIRAWYSGIDDIFMGGMRLLGAYHRLMIPLNIKYTYGWDNVVNEAAITVKQRYGYKFDGLMDYIMLRNSSEYRDC